MRAEAKRTVGSAVDHLRSPNEHAVILSLDTVSVPRIRDSERVEVDDLGHRDDGIIFVRAKHGYVEQFDVPRIVRLIAKAGIEGPLEPREASYFLSKVELKATDKQGMSRWRKRLFLATALTTAEPADYFGLPQTERSSSALTSSSSFASSA